MWVFVTQGMINAKTPDRARLGLGLQLIRMISFLVAVTIDLRCSSYKISGLGLDDPTLIS